MITVNDKGSFNIVKVNKLKHKSVNSSVTIHGNNNEVFIESRCEFKNLIIVIRGDNNKILIKRGSWFQGGNISLVSFSKLEIGERSTFAPRLEFVIESAHVTIGNDCMTAAGLTIRTTDTHGIYSLDDEKIINTPQDITIGDYVWFGKDVTILKGAKVAPCNIIEIQSLFNSKSNPFELWGGRPAKKLKDNVIWAKSAHLEKVSDDKNANLYISKYKQDGAL